MPYVNNNGVNIHYHVEGDGPPLVLQHGFTSSIRNWYVNGYVEPLKQSYRLILVDARGHGRSDKPHDSAAYDNKLRVGDVTSVLDELGIDTAHFLGYSMGGRIGFSIAAYAPERVLSLIFGGMHPYDRSGNITTEDRVRYLKDGMEGYVAHQEVLSGTKMEPDRRARLLDNDHNALIAAISAPRAIPGIEETITKLPMPCMLYVGEADAFYAGVEEASKIIPGVTYASFPGLDHGQVSMRSDVVLPPVTEFLSSVVQQTAVAD